MTVTQPTWLPDSWRGAGAAQQPDWPDPEALTAVRDRIRQLPPLVFAGEARNLLAALGEVAEGRAFLLQAGDCAESFRDVSAIQIREKLKVLLQMSAVLTYGATLPVVKVGRIAGQFAKPRTAATEIVNGVELPTFRGHVVHSDEPTPEARVPDPERILQGYYQAVSTLNLLRAFTKGGFADLTQVHTWNQEFVASSPGGPPLRGDRHRDRPCPALHAGDRHRPRLRAVDPRGRRLDEPRGPPAGLRGAAHAQGLPHGPVVRLLGAHALDRGANATDRRWARRVLLGRPQPDRRQAGPSATAEEVVALCERLNPLRAPGRLTLICRMGAGQVQQALPPLLHAVQEAAYPVVWSCDPMHGNTFAAPSGHKTRRFDDVMREIEGFFAAHREVGTWPGGIHLEFTGDDVTECLGGSEAVLESQLDHRYETLCDPRLNARQALDCAFLIAELMRA